MTTHTLIINLLKTGALLLMFFMVAEMIILYFARRSKPNRVKVIEYMPTVGMVREEPIDDIMIVYGDSEEDAAIVINYLPKIVPVA